MPFSPTSASKPEATEAQEAPAAETETSTEALGDTRQQERQVRLTAQRILAEHLRDDRAEDKRSSGPPSPRFWPDIRLDLTGATLIDFSIQSAVVADAAFGGATFSGDAGFDRATFSGDARFGEATFSGDAGFDGATFSSAAWFDGATFSGDARFGEATFSLDARFDGATFSSDARFDRATFGGVAMFREVAFSSDAWFGEAAFSSDAVFVRADFSGDARFDGATFSGGEACLFFDQSGVALPDAQHVWPTGRWLGPDGKGGYTVVRSEV